MFLMSKDETADVLMIFSKMIQTKLNCKIVGIMSDHVTEFENARVENFGVEHIIHHNFSDPRTPQQNGVVERKITQIEPKLSLS